MTTGKRALTREDAEDVAIKGLTFLLQDPEKLGQFLISAGLGPENIRDAAQNPLFLAAVLDFLLQYEDLAARFATQHALSPQQLMQAHNQLSGKDKELTSI